MGIQQGREGVLDAHGNSGAGGLQTALGQKSSQVSAAPVTARPAPESASMTAWPCPPLLTAADQSLSPPRELPIQEPRCREGGPARALRRVPPTVSYGQTPRLHGSERALFKAQATKPVCAKPSLPAHVNRINLLVHVSVSSGGKQSQTSSTGV